MSCPGCRRLEWGELGGRVLKDSASIKVGTRANIWASDVQRSRPASWHRTCPVRPKVCGIISWACSPTHLTLRQPCRPSHPSPRQAAHSLGINGRGAPPTSKSRQSSHSACVLSGFSCVQFCATPWTPPGSPVHGILQARIQEWAAMPSCRGSSRSRE